MTNKNQANTTAWIQRESPQLQHEVQNQPNCFAAIIMRDASYSAISHDSVHLNKMSLCLKMSSPTVGSTVCPFPAKESKISSPRIVCIDWSPRGKCEEMGFVTGTPRTAQGQRPWFLAAGSSVLSYVHLIPFKPLRWKSQRFVCGPFMSICRFLFIILVWCMHGT